MRVIGLTGSIACGKSTISRHLASLGWPIVDGDEISHGLTGAGGAALPDLRRAFGPSYFLPDGGLDRKKLGALVFSDEQALKTLDDLMAPWLKDAVVRALRRAEDSGAELCFLDCPLLFEKGYDALCRSVWCVYLPPSMQLSRLMERDGLTRDEAIRRIRSVMSSDEKASRSDVVIDNSGTVEETLSRIPALVEAELRAARPAPRKRRSDRYLQEEIPEPPSLSPAPAPAAVRSPAPASAKAASLEPAEDPSSSRAAANVPVPDEGIERSEATRRKPSKRKAVWKLPVWLMVTLISLAAVLAVSFTAQCLMDAYLVRRQEEHVREQNSIDENYPVSWQDLIEASAAEFNLNPAYVTAIIRNESSFRPKVESDVGARGLMQLMPDTAEWIAGKLKVNGYAFERMYDPASNIRFGCWYLNYLSKLFNGDVICVTCAYHAGQGTVTSWLSDSRYSDDGVRLVTDRLPDGPTKQYAERVSRDYGIYQKKVYTADLPSGGAGDAVSRYGSGFLAAQ